MKLLYKIRIILVVLALISINISILQAQEAKKKISEMSKEEILELNYDELLALPFEDLIQIANKFELSAEQLMELFLNKDLAIASKKEEASFESPLSTSVISKEEIQKSGATTIEELFRLIPGVIVREESNGNYDIHIRGNDNVPPGNFSHFTENSMTLVMIDNRIVYNYINGGTFFESLPIGLSDIESLEIIRGPSSALYGPNAVSGVVNIVTRKPEGKKLKVDADAQYGNFNTKIADIALSKGFGKKIKFRISGNYEYRDRFQEEYYAYTTAKYVDVRTEKMKSLFGNDDYYQNGTTLPTIEMAKDRFGANAFLFFDANKQMNFSLAGGLQKSEIQSVFFENLATPFSNRQTDSKYIDFRANVHGIQAQVSYINGVQDLSVGMSKPVIKYDMSTTNITLEYDLTLKNLTIRPGINYQKAVYDDSKYVEEAKKVDPSRQGLLNGSNQLENMAFSLRADYKPTEKLRFVAALRTDKYDKPDKTYFSFQFIGSYKINQNHIFRAVYSRANRGAFIGDVYAQFKNPLFPKYLRLNPTKPSDSTLVYFFYQYYYGKEDLKLLTMDNYEIGFRNKISNYIQTDIELFYSKSTDFDALVRDKLYLEPFKVGGQTVPGVNITHEERRYKNLDLTSHQIGASVNVKGYINKTIQMNFFVTFQQTKLKNFAPKPDTKPDSTIEFDHKWTPAFFGGFGINCAPVEKLNINTNLYFYGKQEFMRYQAQKEIYQTEVDPKVIVNIKISYKFWNNHQIYFNARNLLNSSNKEFAFADDIKGLYLIGLNLSF